MGAVSHARATAAVRAARELGVEFELAGGVVRYRPAVTAELTRELRAVREEVLALLKAERQEPRPIIELVSDLFDGELMPDAEGPEWDDCVPLEFEGQRRAARPDDEAEQTEVWA